MIKAIFAVDHWGGIGLNGKLPWPHHTEDMQYFKEQTEGHIVIMGRKTWESLPAQYRPLPNRENYVVSNKPITLSGWGVKRVSGDLHEEIKRIAEANPGKDIWIIGGADIIDQTRGLVDLVHLTHFKGQFKIDTKVDLKKYLFGFRALSAKPSKDGKCTWMTYKNEDIFRDIKASS